MAAQPNRQFESLVVKDLRRLNEADLAPLLEEETHAWRSLFDWDFRPAGDLVRRFMRMRSLDGMALLIDGQVAGYSYYVADEGKGLIGDFYVRPSVASIDTESVLLQAVLDSLWSIPGVRRVEAQMLMLRSAAPSLTYPLWLRAFPRRFVEARLPLSALLPERVLPRASLVPWSLERQDDAADLMAQTYRGHVDSEINDQYRTTFGARRFLHNIVQFPGCGNFFPTASFFALDRATSAVVGLSLASLVAPQTGHITQICVGPSHQGSGTGYELLRQSMVALQAHGCRSVSLTVTSSNDQALRLYESMGFRTRSEFAAHVWELR